MNSSQESCHQDMLTAAIPTSEASASSNGPSLQCALEGANQAASSPVFSPPQSSSTQLSNPHVATETRQLRKRPEVGPRRKRKKDFAADMCLDKERRRQQEDEYLVQARAASIPYKRIKEEGGFSEAEETLRGRYRCLTKPKEQRVRSPIWTDGDVCFHCFQPFR